MVDEVNIIPNYTLNIFPICTDRYSPHSQSNKIPLATESITNKTQPIKIQSYEVQCKLKYVKRNSGAQGSRIISGKAYKIVRAREKVFCCETMSLSNIKSFPQEVSSTWIPKLQMSKNRNVHASREVGKLKRGQCWANNYRVAQKR